ncbi:MAG: trypsin-like serine protease [Bacillota bacterium]
MMIKKYLTFGLLASVLSACSIGQNPEQQLDVSKATPIVNGMPVEANNSLSKQVLLLQVTAADGEAWTCTATALSKRIILTAAHCVTFDTQKISASWINSSTSKVEKVGQAKAAIRHEAYESPLDILTYGDNDVALVFLKSDLPSFVEITQLYNGTSSYAKADILMAGHAITETDPVTDGVRNPGKDFHTVLNYGTATYEDAVNTTIILSPNSKSHGCLGDSGGPALVKTSDGTRKQFGILSRISSADCLVRNVYESTTAQAEWIQYNLKKFAFYQAVTETQTAMPSAQPTKEMVLTEDEAQKSFDKILNLIKNEYVEYECYQDKKGTLEKLESDLFENILEEIESVNSVTAKSHGAEVTVTASLTTGTSKKNQTTITLATSNDQSFVPEILRERKTAGTATKFICKAKFINAIEMK